MKTQLICMLSLGIVLSACNSAEEDFESSLNPSVSALAIEEAIDTSSMDSALVDETILSLSDSVESETTGLGADDIGRKIRGFRFKNSSGCPETTREELDQGFRVTRRFDNCQPGRRASGKQRGKTVDGQSVLEVIKAEGDDGEEAFDRQISLTRDLAIRFANGKTHEIDVERSWTVQGSVASGVEINAQLTDISRISRNAAGAVLRSRRVSGERQLELVFQSGELSRVILNGVIEKELSIRDKSFSIQITSTDVTFEASCAFPVSGSRVIRIEKASGEVSEHRVEYTGSCGQAEVDEKIEDLLEPEAV